MNTTLSSSLAAQAEDLYRRDRAARTFRSAGGAHHHHVSRWRTWRPARPDHSSEA